MAKKRRPAARPRKTSFDFENSPWFVPLVFVGFAIALVILFSSFIFSDQMLFGSDILQASLMFRIYQTTYMAAHGFLNIPQWIPHQFGGMPFVEAFHSDIFYPPSLVGKWLLILFNSKVEAIDVARLLGWELLIHIFLAGLFMYWAARQFKLRKVPALLAGAAYMFAGYLVSMIAPGHDGKIYVATLFPLMMLFLDRGFERRPFLNFSLLGLVIGLILLTPHPQMSYFSLWALSLYAAYRLILMFVDHMSLRTVVKPALWVVYAVVLGVMLSAIQMYPGVTYTSNFSPRADTKKGWDWATSWSMHEEEAASLVIPEFSGTNSQKAQTFYWGKNFFKDNSEWLGTIALFLAMLGVAAYRNRRQAWFFFGLAVFAFTYALGATTPLFHLYFLIPKVSSMRGPSMIMFLASFSVALLAAMALQEIMKSREDRQEIEGKAFQYIFVGFPALLFVLALGFSLAGRSMMDLWTSIFYSSAATDMVQQNVSKLDIAYMNLPSIQRGAWFAFFFVGIAALFIWMYRQGKMGTGALIAVIALTVVDGVRFDDRFIDVVDQRQFAAKYEPNAMTDYLTRQPDQFRVLPLTEPNDATLAGHGIDATVGYHGNQLRWYDDLLGGPALTNVRSLNTRLLNLVGTKYLINPTQRDLPPDFFGPKPLTEVGNFGGQRLIENDNALPRVFLADSYDVIPDEKTIDEQVLHGTSNMSHTVYLEEKPTLDIRPDTALTDSMVTDSAWIIDYQADSVLIGVHATRNELLVLTDTWFDAWHATVDGQPAKIYRADGAFRAVEIPAGSQRVLFRYHSSRYVLGKTISFITWGYLVIVLAALWFWYGRRNESETETGQQE